MTETKQISATINLSLANWIASVAKQEKRTHSQMIGILLEEAKSVRVPKKEKTK